MRHSAFAVQHKAALIFCSLLMTGSLWAADTPATQQAAPSKETREKMAQAHEKMAACLRSERELSDCRKEMMQSCQDVMGDQGCGMMMGRGMMRRNPPTPPRVSSK